MRYSRGEFACLPAHTKWRLIILHTSFSPDDRLAQDASRRFERAFFVGQLRRLAALITQEDRRILWLGDIERAYTVTATEKLDEQAIRVESISGTQGRTGYYDRDFYPLDRRFKDRWVSVAVAMLRDVNSVPPIEVVQANSECYVIDGHHRVSVAHSLDLLYIDAVVTVWTLAPRATEEND